MPQPIMTDKQVLAEMQSNTMLNRARKIFSFSSAAIEQAGQQRTPLSPLDLRRMEFAAVRKIAEALGVDVEGKQ